MADDHEHQFVHLLHFQFNLVSPAGDAGKFLDYPTLGVDASALYIGGVRFNPNVFDGCPVFVVRKSSVLGAGPIVATAFRTAGGTSTGIYVPQGVHNDDPAATEGYFIGTDAGVYGAINVIRIGTPGGTPTMTALPAITIPLNSNPQLQVHQARRPTVASTRSTIDSSPRTSCRIN